MLNHLTERAPPARRHAASASAARSASAAARRSHGAEPPRRVPPGDGLPVWRYEVDGYVLEKRVLLPHRQNTVHVIYRLLAGRRAGAAEAAPVGPLPRPRRAGQRRRSPSPTPLTAVDDRYELSRRRPHCRRCGCRSHGERPAFTARRPARSRACCYRVEERRGYDVAGDLWSPGYFRVDLAPGRDAVTLVASTEPWETIAGAAAATRPWPPSCERRRAARRRGRSRARARARPPSWCWPPTSSSSRPPAASRTRPAPAPPATRSARSSPATTGSPTGAATP